MNEIPISLFNSLFGVDLIVIAYALYGIDFNKEVKIDKIISTIIASPLSFILGNYIVNGEVVQTAVTGATITNGISVANFNYIPFQSLPLHYLLLGFAILMTILSVLLIVKFISDHFEKKENESALGDWRQNSFMNRR